MGTSRGAGRQPPRSMISAAPRRGERAPRGRGRGGSPSAGAPGGPRPEPGEGRRTGRSTPAPGAAATCVPRAVATSRTRSHACPAHSRSARWSCAVRNSASAGCVSQGRAGSTAGRRAPRSPASATGQGVLRPHRSRVGAETRRRRTRAVRPPATPGHPPRVRAVPGLGCPRRARQPVGRPRIRRVLPGPFGRCRLRAPPKYAAGLPPPALRTGRSSFRPGGPDGRKRRTARAERDVQPVATDGRHPALCGTRRESEWCQ
jgi:hypothetical protein